ncbi:hypothetical protein PVL29_015337 [Vitis rotundifolia]|uniref:Uncharacterized protein n=1 Tax=Vitis rotundifolia TaxID=103349 RepID=A0AA38ZCB1_VITRO|nr:hypothetical protein PVL29_015337 [Vitis rotundifolia]
MIELHKQGVVDMSKLIWISFNINTEVCFKDPQTLKLFQHLCIGEEAILVCVKIGKAVMDQTIECFFIFHKADNGGTVQYFHTHSLFCSCAQTG